MMLSQDGETYILSHAPTCTCLTDKTWPSLESDGAENSKCKRGSKQPGLDFFCPPVLVELLGHHWRDLQDGFSDPEELDKILVFQSDELRWTAQKRGRFGGLRWIKMLQHGSAKVVAAL